MARTTKTLTGTTVSVVAKRVQTQKTATLRITGAQSGATKTVTITINPRT